MFKLLVAITVLAVVAAQSSPEPSEKCSGNQSWSICGQMCEPSCDLPHPNPKFCPRLPCVGPLSGCRCKKGFVRNENNHCVLLKDCPPRSDS
ncbi:chymotrypsin inhibitor [Megalopta genalis]|uniref:chymotrypsin inhibitor n=1 Tax=Megalopta genalis TaxID=115081 RepID=UPI003FD2FFA5